MLDCLKVFGLQITRGVHIELRYVFQLNMCMLGLIMYVGNIVSYQGRVLQDYSHKIVMGCSYKALCHKSSHIWWSPGFLNKV